MVRASTSMGFFSPGAGPPRLGKSSEKQKAPVRPGPKTTERNAPEIYMPTRPPQMGEPTESGPAARHHRRGGRVSDFDPLPLLRQSGVSALTKFSSVATVTAALKQYLALLNGTRGLDLEAARVMAFREVKAHAV